MSNVIFIGMPYSGKSFVGSHFAKKYNMGINLDNIIQKVIKNIGKKSRPYLVRPYRIGLTANNRVIVVKVVVTCMDISFTFDNRARWSK